MPELVSIVVTSYNHAEYLDQRMQSLLSQTYSDIEIIVVDDRSEDNSLLVLKKYEKFNNVSIHTFEKNRGYAAACNYGVERCRGEFIMFAECDDFNLPTHVEYLMNCFRDNPSAGVVFCRSNMVDAQGIRFGDDFKYREKKFKNYCRTDILIPMQKMQNFFLIHCVVPNMSAALIRKSVFKSVCGLDSSFQACADWDFWCRVSKKFDFYYVTHSLNNFRTHYTTVRSTSGTLLSMTEIIRLLYGAFEKKLNPSFYEFFYFRVNIGIIWADYFISNPSNWTRSFFPIYRYSKKYDNMGIVYYFLGFFKKAFDSLLGIALKRF